MKILHRHITIEFVKILLITLIAFIAIFMLIDFVEMVDELVEKKVPVFDTMAFFLYKIPRIFGLISPIAVLLSVLLSLGMLSKHNEIIAIKAGGVGILKVVTPLLVCGLIVTLVVIFINEIVVPITNNKGYAIEMKWLNKKPRGMFNREGLWIRGPEGIYNIMKLDLKNNTIKGITLIRFSKDFRITERVNAETARWMEGSWIAEEAESYQISAEGLAVSKGKGRMALPNLMGPEDFSVLEKSHENMSLMELNSYIHTLREEGYNATRYVVDMYGKITFPIINFLMVLIGIPFALREGRRGGFADGVAISVAIGFSFWVVFAVTRSLGQNGVIPPIVAASFTDILFLAIGGYLYGYVRQ